MQTNKMMSLNDEFKKFEKCPERFFFIWDFVWHCSLIHFHISTGVTISSHLDAFKCIFIVKYGSRGHQTYLICSFLDNRCIFINIVNRQSLSKSFLPQTLSETFVGTQAIFFYKEFTFHPIEQSRFAEKAIIGPQRQPGFAIIFQSSATPDPPEIFESIRGNHEVTEDTTIRRFFTITSQQHFSMEVPITNIRIPWSFSKVCP